MKNLTLLLFACSLFQPVFSQRPELSVQIDGAKKYQSLEGFGVSINTAWWYNGAYTDAKVVEPAIDLLVDSLGITIFRAVIEEIDWEEVNDDADPNHFNREYFNKIFTGPRFTGVWNTLKYLNQKGIKDGLMLSFMGSPPAPEPLMPKDPRRSWMGGTDYSIDPGKEDEFVESIAALLLYARNTAKIDFHLISPMNETEQVVNAVSTDYPEGIVEGPNVPDPVQFTRILVKLARKLDAEGMQDIRFVAPDAAGDRLFSGCLDEMVKDPYLMGKLAHWGVHQYGSQAENYRTITERPSNPNKSYWVTEMAGIGNLMGQLRDSAQAYIFWDGFDCVYQHARRNRYGDIPPNDWVFWFGPGEGKPLIEFDPVTKTWTPRKQFYHFAQVFNYVKPGALRLDVTGNDTSLMVHSFLNPDGRLVITGRYTGHDSLTLHGILKNLPEIQRFVMTATTPSANMKEIKDIIVTNKTLGIVLPPESVFTLTGKAEADIPPSSAARPEPAGWYSGDMHIHRNCGEATGILDESAFVSMMEVNDLDVISVLADMGNGEVKDSKQDLPKVNGKDAPESKPGRIVHWDAEWHFDPAGVTFEHKALGGHVVLLGLQEAHTIWNESPYKIIEWGKAQQAVIGFCHMQYLSDTIPGTLDCCAPLDFPVEAALGNLDFLAEDVWLNDAAVHAYYRLLNCGFRTGWAAGTDYPCNNSQPFGSLLTYVEVKEAPLTYEKWISGIKKGRTVVSTHGHAEFLELRINGSATPGDEINLKKKGKLPIEVKWTTTMELSGRIEIVCNGKVIAVSEGKAAPGQPLVFSTSADITESSWICARRMDDNGHRSHTAPVYVTLKNAPVRASKQDALFFTAWIDNLLEKTAPGGPWSTFFTSDPETVRNRYQQARAIYMTIAGQSHD